jgi:hypothetical protein
MANLNLFIDAVVENITKELGDSIVMCKPLAGLLETTELSAIHGKTPGIFVTVVGSSESTLLETEQVDSTMLVVAYVLVVKPDSMEREKLSNELVSNLLSYVPGQRWGLNNAYYASAVECADLHGLAKGFKPDVSSWRYGVSVLARAADLYGGTDPISNMALWAVTWEQKLRLGKSVFEEDSWPGLKEVYVKENGSAPALLDRIEEHNG